MLKTVSGMRTSLRSFNKILATARSFSTLPSPSLPSTSSKLRLPSTWTPYLPYSRSSKQNKEHTHEVVSLFNRDSTSPPNLFVVQPRLRPDKFLQAKLHEALCLGNSLEEQRDGYFDTGFFDKALPPHIIVQNPSMKGHKARAGL